MAKQALIDCTLIWGGASVCQDLSGDANSIGMDFSVEELDTTAFADTVRKRIAGLLTSTANANVRREVAEQPWTDVQSLFAGNAIIGFIESNASMAEGDRAWFGQILQSSYETGGDVGALDEFRVAGSGSDALLLGRVLQQDTSAIASTSTTTGIQFGSTAGKTVYAAQWVLSGTGTLDTVIQRDDNSGFTSAQTLITFAQNAGTAEAQFLSATGNADDYYRCSYTVGTGPFTAIVAMAAF